MNIKETEAYKNKAAELKAKGDAAKGFAKFIGKIVIVIILICFALGFGLTAVMKYNDHQEYNDRMAATYKFVAGNGDSLAIKMNLQKETITLNFIIDGKHTERVRKLIANPNNKDQFKYINGKGEPVYFKYDYGYPRTFKSTGVTDEGEAFEREFIEVKTDAF